MNRCLILFIAVLVLSLTSVQCLAVKTPSRLPNIIFLFADDLRWGDLGLVTSSTTPAEDCKFFI